MNERHKHLGIVFSGGGVRGLAHVGVIKALEEYNIQPDYIAGASAGAIVGAFYAAGYGSGDILDFFKTTSLFKWSNFAFSKPGLIDMDKFISVFEQYFPENSFETLKKPLFITATDIVNGKSRLFSKGKLIEAILASAAFPLVFSPVQIGENLYSDGGIMNNFPIEPLQSYCDKIIGVYVSPVHPVDKSELTSAISVMERVYHIGVNSSSLSKLHHCDVLINPDELSTYGAFSLKYIEEIYQIGYRAAIEQLREWRVQKS